MCTVSMTGDQWKKTLQPHFPGYPTVKPEVSREEFEELRRLVEEMHKALIEAKEEDIRDGNPDCEMEDKVAFIRYVSDYVGVSLEDVFGKEDK